MTEEEKKEFEEFLEWKAEKKRKEEENKAKQEEAERQVKVNQVEEEESMEFDNKQVPYSSNNKNESNNTGEKPTTFPLAFVLLISLIIFLFCICIIGIYMTYSCIRFFPF